MTDILTGPLAKIERAKHHINDLNRQVETYSAQRPMRIVRRLNEDRSHLVYTIKTKIPMPDEIPLILGDAVHNLRTGLDILIFEMIGDKCPAPRQVQFPFARKEEALSSTIDNRQIRFAGEDVVRQIHELKPYPGGNDLLNGVHELDLTDKHKLIIPVSRSAGLTYDELVRIVPGLRREPLANTTVILGEGVTFNVDFSKRPRRERRAFQSLSMTEQETDIQPTSTVCFGEGQPFPLQPVVPILVSLAEETERAISVIAGVAKG